MGLKLLVLLGILAVLGHLFHGPPIASSANVATQKQPKSPASKTGFTEGRLKVLKCIISNGGSVQSYDVFTYEEYTRIGQLDRKIAKPFQRNARLLKKNISQLVGRHPDIAKNSALNGIEETLKREVKGKKIGGPMHAMVMDCKNFMRNLLSEGGEGSWLDVFTFIHSKDPKKEDEWRHLETIHELSKIQSLALDKLTNRLLLKEHMENKPKGIGLHRAVIVGAGPIGQFAAIRLFVAGFDVMVTYHSTIILKYIPRL
ncbi:hypothetical protein Ddc_12649 [Ditylenchus destructor]|nr:hypothetical protein Ddc_12649 [Ditylenchus destructor]